MVKTVHIHKIWKIPKPLENNGKEGRFQEEKFSKKCLTRGEGFGIIVKLARAKAREKGEANLENDTEKKRAIRKEDSEDSKE